MRTTLALVVVGMALVLSGCGPLESIHPLFTANDLVLEPALLGTWAVDTKRQWIFRKAEGQGYHLEVAEEGEAPMRFEAHLVRLHEFLFLDLARANTEVRTGSYTLLPAPHLTRAGHGVFLARIPLDPESPSGAFRVDIITTHIFFKVRIEDDVLHLASLDGGDWLKESVARQEITLAEHEILTAPTDKLQTFILLNAWNDRAFGELDELHRRK